MRMARSTIVFFFFLALTMGCTTQMPVAQLGEEVPLSELFLYITRQFGGVETIRTHLSVQLEFGDEYYVLRGVMIYEKPGRLRLELASGLGGVVVELLHEEGVLSILLPSSGEIYQGVVPAEGCEGRMRIVCDEYQDIGERRIPARISGEGIGVVFRVRFTETEVDVPLPSGAFTMPQVGWKVRPLEELARIVRGGA